MRAALLVLSFILISGLVAAPAGAQSPIQWSGSAKMSVDRAVEMGVPVMFWVTDGNRWDDDDMKDAQRDAFRDPVVLAITERYFVPCRVSRNSNVLAEAERLGLPTHFGLYIAIVTPEGKLVDSIPPDQVATPELLAERLAAASRKYRDSVYAETLKPVITDLKADRSKVAEAVRAVWRMRIYSADQDIIALLSRDDVKGEQRSRLYQMLAAFATPASINALLDAAPKDKAAVAALSRAEPGALPTLVDAMPAKEGEATPRQIAAYRAAALVSKVGAMKDDKWWTTATPADREKERERVRAAAIAIHNSWWDREGHWR
jgi:hypothetical protein